jgi:hypothetical protein
MHSSESFSKLNIREKCSELKKQGSYLAAREFGAYFVYLYAYNDFYVELWRTIAHNQTVWVELADQRVVDTYLEKIKLNLH